jgi:hypothetical protein
VKKTIKG